MGREVEGDHGRRGEVGIAVAAEEEVGDEVVGRQERRKLGWIRRLRRLRMSLIVDAGRWRCDEVPNVDGSSENEDGRRNERKTRQSSIQTSVLLFASFVVFVLT